MGDYKLKTAKDYVVPESQRVNAEKKRIQLLNLLDQVNCTDQFLSHVCTDIILQACIDRAENTGVSNGCYGAPSW